MPDEATCQTCGAGLNSDGECPYLASTLRVALSAMMFSPRGLIGMSVVLDGRAIGTVDDFVLADGRIAIAIARHDARQIQKTDDTVVA